MSKENENQSENKPKKDRSPSITELINRLERATTPEPSYGIQEVPFPEEVEQVMQDVRFAVEEISRSTNHPATQINAYLNIVTKENKTLFILMSPQGFRILGNEKDTANVTDGATYETIQALLDHESPEYRRRFSEALAERLKAIIEQEKK